MGPVLKKRPNWLSQKKNRRPDTPVVPKTSLCGCASNCTYRQYSSGNVKRPTSTSASHHRGCRNCRQSFVSTQCTIKPAPIVISTNGPFVITAHAASSE